MFASIVIFLYIWNDIDNFVNKVMACLWPFIVGAGASIAACKIDKNGRKRK